MAEIEELLKQVVAESGKSLKEIQAKMDERKEKTHGLLSDYGALYAVAKEYGLDLSSNDMEYADLSKLTPSNSINILARIKTIFSPREFDKKDGSKGKFASVILFDSKGESRLVLWDSKTSVLSDMRGGDILQVKNAYVKDNRGVMEIHAGALTNMTVNPKDAGSNLPEIVEKIDEISGIEAGTFSINMVCRVSSHFPKTEFTRSDGSTGSRASFMAEDESGKVRMVIWDPLSEIELKDGDIIKISNAYSKEGLNGKVEIHGGSRTRIEKSDAKLKLNPLPKKTEGKVEIGKINKELNGFTVEARVLKVYEPREYSRGTMASLILGDSTSTIRAVLWTEQSHHAKNLSEGDAIRIDNCYSKKNMNDEFEIHVGKYSKVKSDKGLDVPTSTEINEVMAEQKNIGDLDSSDRYVKIQGKITAVEDKAMIYMTCGECNKKVQNMGGEWMCEECGVVEGQPNMVASIILEDKTGNIRAVGFKDNAEKMMGLDIDQAMLLIAEAQDEKAPIEHARKTIIGKKMIVLGRVNYNDYSDQLEFMINDIA